MAGRAKFVGFGCFSAGPFAPPPPPPPSQRLSHCNRRRPSRTAPSPPPTPPQRLPHSSRRRRKPDPLGQGLVFGDLLPRRQPDPLG